MSFRNTLDPQMGAGHPLKLKDLLPDRDMKKIVKKHRQYQIE